MPSRSDKVDKVKDNIDKGIRRAINQWEQDNHKRCPDKIKQIFKRDFTNAAKYHVDKQLHEVWND